MRTLHQSKAIGKAEYEKLKFSCNNKKLLRAMALLYYGGFRVSEVLQIKRLDIEQMIEKDQGEVLISKQKIKRTLFLSKSAKQEFMLLLRTCKAERFVHYKGDSLRVCLNAYIKSVLGEGYSSHGFRRGFITKIIHTTGNPKLAQGVIGHKNIHTTLHYDAISTEDMQKAYELMD